MSRVDDVAGVVVHEIGAELLELICDVVAHVEVIEVHVALLPGVSQGGRRMREGGGRMREGCRRARRVPLACCIFMKFTNLRLP